MISVNNSLTARKCYSSREYFHPLGCIKRFKWIFRKVLVVHCLRCHIAKKLSYCQKVIIILPKIACCTKEHFARHHTSRKMFSFLLCLQSAVRKCFLFLFRVSILQMFINQLFSTSTTVVTILSFKNLAKKSKHQNKHCQRHNGPEGWVLLTKVTSLGHITSSYTNLDQTFSESRPSTNFKISNKHQHFEKT